MTQEEVELDRLKSEEPLWTIVHINSAHRRLGMGITVVRAVTIEAALQKLAIHSKNRNEKSEPLCAFAGLHENLLPMSGGSMKPAVRPSKQIDIVRDLPKGRDQ